MLSLLLLLLSVNKSFEAFLITPRIFGGEKATENQFPFLTSLRRLDRKTGIYKHECGASIISNEFLLTAAHCYNNKLQLNDYRVSVGAHKTEDEGEVHEIEKFIIHPEYDEDGKYNDIALVKVARRFRGITSTIEISREFIEDKKNAMAIGWGRSEDKYTGLKFALLSTMSNEECRELSVAYAPIRNYSTLCAFSGRNGTGICMGDSGGALVAENKLIGIASWGLPCAKGFPDGFSRVSYFAAWIDEQIQTN